MKEYLKYLIVNETCLEKKKKAGYKCVCLFQLGKYMQFCEYKIYTVYSAAAG